MLQLTIVQKKWIFKPICCQIISSSNYWFCCHLHSAALQPFKSTSSNLIQPQQPLRTHSIFAACFRCITVVQVMVFSYLACVCPRSTCFTKSLCFICLGQHNQWVYYDGVIIVPTLILLSFFLAFFVCSPRRKLPRTYWPSSTLDVTHIALSMCIVFMCPPSWVLEEMQRDKNTKRVSSEIVPLETSESRAKWRVPAAWFSPPPDILTACCPSLQTPQPAHWRDSAVSSAGPLLTRWPAGWDRAACAETPPERHGGLWPVPTNPPTVPQPHQRHADLPQWRLPAWHRLQQQPVLRLLRVLLLHGGRAPHGRGLQRLQVRPSC